MPVSSGWYAEVSAESIGRLAETIAGMERGKRAEQSEYLAEHLRDDLSIEGVREVLAASAAYLKQRPDADAEAKLERIDWDRDERSCPSVT